MKQEQSEIKSDILLRVRILYIAFVVIGMIVFGRLIWVQFCSSEVATNAERLMKRIYFTQKIPAQRGNILARDGSPLATSICRYQVAFDFGAEGLDSLDTYRRQSDSLAVLLAAFFKDKPAKEYSRLFQEEHTKHYRRINHRDTTYLRSEGTIDRMIDKFRGEEHVTEKLFDAWRDHRPVNIFPREVDYAEWQILKGYPLLNNNMGMVYTLLPSDERIYPQGNLAKRTVGSIKEDKGESGIEWAYEQELAGQDGLVRRQRIARNFTTRVTDSLRQDPLDGVDIVTTIDLGLQDVADKVLRRQLEVQNAYWGTTLIMEVATGDLLAMVNLARNNNGTYSEQQNHALGARMEPGSTFKLAAMLALLEDKGADLSLTYDTGDGKLVSVGRAQIKDSHGGFSRVNLKTATAQSLNVYFATAIYEAYKHEPKRYTDFLRKLHLDRPMGLERLGEKKPTFIEPGSRGWTPDMSLPNMGYGYAIELVPVQTLTLYNAVANDGVMVAPRLIREYRRGEEVIEQMKPTVIVDRICSKENLARVRECLEEVALTGTAARYFKDTTRFYVAGKTGTAMSAQDEYGRGVSYKAGYHLGTMVVYLPADKPRYTILTAVFTRTGRGGTTFGAGLAGPVEKQVANYLYSRSHDWDAPLSTNGPKRYPAAIKGGSIAQVRRVADKFSPHVSFDTRQGWGRVRIDTLSNAVVTTLPGDGLMPDVGGMGLKDALFLLESYGLKVRFSGQGAVVSQSIAAGSPIPPGAAVELMLN